jgi:acyl-CoA synthetase (AMP-forming)/AMP-acid ligase II
MKSPAVCDWVFEHARRTPDAAAIDSPDHRLSYLELARRIVDVAGALRLLGVGVGDRVLVALPHAPGAVVSSLAVQHLGAIAVDVNREWPAERFARVLAHVEPRVVAFAERDREKLTAACAAAGVQTLIVTEGGRVDGGPRAPADLPGPTPRDPDAVTLLLYTSGSTGVPRAVMQTTANIAANTRAIVEVLGLTSRDRAMLVLPLSYCYGRSVLQTHLFAGGSVFLDPRFMYPPLVLEALAGEQCTGFAGVPLTFELLRRHATIDVHRMPALRYLTQAGGAMRPDTTDWVRAAFAPVPLFVMYGQTEATARLTYLPPERARDKRGSIGLPVPSVDLRVVDDQGNEVASGVPGHIVARGPSVTPGYFAAPGDTAAILRDGWLWTGDLGHRDRDGFFYLAGRSREILKVGGHRGSPAEIEAALGEHPDVVEMAVAGVADALLGEVPGVLAVVRAGAGVTERDLQRFCGERLPPPMVPRIVRFAPELPRSPSGKIVRDEVVRALALPPPPPASSNKLVEAWRAP